MPVVSSIGQRREPIEVRLGAAMRPQRLTIKLGSTTAFDPAGGELVGVFFARESAPDPLPSPRFLVTPILGPLFRIELPVDRVVALYNAVERFVPTDPEIARKLRMAWYVRTWVDSAGHRTPIDYGRIDIYLGASGRA